MLLIHMGGEMMTDAASLRPHPSPVSTWRPIHPLPQGAVRTWSLLFPLREKVPEGRMRGLFRLHTEVSA